MTTFMSVDDGQVPGNTLEEKQATLKEWYSLNLEQYYEQIKPFTFITDFIQMEIEDILIFQKYIRQTKMTNEEIERWKIRILDPLEKSIHSFPNGAFVKLSTRSPKDAVDKDKERLMKHLKITNPNSLNQIYIDVRKSFFNFMRVFNAQDALDIMSKSGRIISDLKRAVDFKDILKEIPLNIVVREFVEFDITNEFRAFYYSGKLTGISQYDINCFFTVPKDIKERVNKFIEKVSLKKDCVIDLVVTETNIWIVELNPFSQSSGSALFNWNKDLKQLQEGPFEFRKLEQERSNEYLKAILSSWNHFIDESIKKERQENESFCNIF